MTTDGGSVQRLDGRYNAQAADGSRATVNVVNNYQSAPAAPVDADVLAEAGRLLAQLPADELPEPSGLPAGSHMPWRRNALFVGREADLKALASVLKTGGTAAVGQSAAVTGLGGIGKTQLASEFVYRYGQYFTGGVFWLSFAEPEAIASEVGGCGGPRALNLAPGFDNRPLGDQVGLVASAWHGKLPRLLVFDNCEDEELLTAWTPRSGGCRVPVTSRRAGWSPELGVSAVPLGVLDRQESIDLLRKHRPDLADDTAGLDAIAEALGDLPLALHLAGSFLGRYQHAPFGSPAGYLAEIKRPELLEHKSMTIGGLSPTGHEQHVARSFALSYGQLRAEDETDALAMAVLSRAAWFAPGEPIPRDLVRMSAGVEADDAAATMRFEDGLSRLDALGLIEGQEDGALVLHRLLGAFVRSEDDDAEAARGAVEAAVLAEARRLNRAGYPAPLQAWQPHLRAVAEQADGAGSENAAPLLNDLGYHLRMVADFVGARVACERALAIDEAAHGSDHPNVAIRLNNLGSVLKAQGDLPGARAAFERALAIDEAAHGPNHPNVPIRISNLGTVLHDQGDSAGRQGGFQAGAGYH